VIQSARDDAFAAGIPLRTRLAWLAPAQAPPPGICRFVDADWLTDAAAVLVLSNWFTPPTSDAAAEFKRIVHPLARIIGQRPPALIILRDYHAENLVVASRTFRFCPAFRAAGNLCQDALQGAIRLWIWCRSLQGGRRGADVAPARRAEG